MGRLCLGDCQQVAYGLLSMNALILGSNSDIAKSLTPLMERDGWNIIPWYRQTAISPLLSYEHVDGKFVEKVAHQWDLCICFIGRVSPVGLWYDVSDEEWEKSIESNLIAPVRLLRSVWGQRKPGASVCFMAGSNPQMVMAGYSAYNAGKMALLKVCEQLDHESGDTKFFALGPGIVLTKIHNATLEAKWPNPKLQSAMQEGRSTPITSIYACLKWCLRQSKSVVGGRNICVSDSEDWESENELQRMLESNPSMFKLRRQE